MNRPFWITYRWPLIIGVILIALIGGAALVLSNTQETLKDGQIIDYTSRAEQAVEEKHYQQAFTLFQQALQIDPANKEYYLYRLGDVAFLNGDFEIAESYYKQVTENSAEVMYYTALQELALLRFNEALNQSRAAEQYIDEHRPLKVEDIRVFQEAVKNFNGETNTPLQQAKVGQFLIEKNALSLAQEALQRLVNSQADYRDAHYLLGVAYLKSGKTEQAKESLQKALKIDPNYKPAQTLLAGLQ